MKKSLVLTSLAVATLALSACASDMGYNGGGGHHARPGGNHSDMGRPNNGAHRPDANPGRPHGRPDGRPNNQNGRPNNGGQGGQGGHNGGGRPPMGNSGPAQCSVSDYSQYVGRMQNTVPRAPRGLTFRFIGPNTPTTRDYRADRVNFNHNAQGVITSVTCG